MEHETMEHAMEHAGTHQADNSLRSLAQKRLAVLRGVEQEVEQPWNIGEKEECSTVQRSSEWNSGTRGRCSTCQRLEGQGVSVLICTSCGYARPEMRVRIALDDLRLTIDEVVARSGLDLDEAYRHLGHLYDLGQIDTDIDGRFWLTDG